MLPKIKIVPQSSVLFSAVISSQGGSARILQGCQDISWQGFISENIIAEVLKNLELKFPGREKDFLNLIESTNLEFVEKIDLEEIEACKAMIKDIDDAHILALAKKVKADFLITLDQKHFISDSQVAKKSNLKILTPGDFLRLMRNQGVIS